jgi:hypothetical protein
MVLSSVFFFPPPNKNLFANTVKHYFSLKVKMYSSLVNVRLLTSLRYTYWDILAEKSTSAIYREGTVACYVSLAVGVAMRVWNLVLPNWKRPCGQVECLEENRCGKTIRDMDTYSWLKLWVWLTQ